MSGAGGTVGTEAEKRPSPGRRAPQLGSSPGAGQCRTALPRAGLRSRRGTSRGGEGGRPGRGSLFASRAPVAGGTPGVCSLVTPVSVRPAICPCQGPGCHSCHCAFVSGETNGPGQQTNRNNKQRNGAQEGKGAGTWGPGSQSQDRAHTAASEPCDHRSGAFFRVGEGGQRPHAPVQKHHLGHLGGGPSHPDSQWRNQTRCQGPRVLVLAHSHRAPCDLGGCHLSARCSNPFSVTTGSPWVLERVWAGRGCG